MIRMIENESIVLYVKVQIMVIVQYTLSLSLSLLLILIIKQSTINVLNALLAIVQ